MPRLPSGRFRRDLLPAVSLALVLAAIAWLNPRAISYFGFTLMLNLAVPIALATVAQMFVIAGNDLDLSIGPFVGFAACVGATWLADRPLVGILLLAPKMANWTRRLSKNASGPTKRASARASNTPRVAVGARFERPALA